MTRIRLARALAKESDRPELDSVLQRQGGGAFTVAKEVHLKRRDYVSIIDRLTARIESLERTRAELATKGDGGDGEPPESHSFSYNVVDGRKSHADTN